MLAEQALERLVTGFAFETVLDVGAGGLGQAGEFVRRGKTVTAVDRLRPARVPAGIEFIQADVSDPGCPVWARGFDCVWCSHVLEHQRNVGWFLERLIASTKEDGVLAVTVPPLKHQIVSGHLSGWNLGLLCYNLIVAGLDLRGATTVTQGYNVSVIARKRTFDPAKLGLTYHSGDIARVSRYFPVAGLVHGFDGRTLTNPAERRAEGLTPGCPSESCARGAPPLAARHEETVGMSPPPGRTKVRLRRSAGVGQPGVSPSVARPASNTLAPVSQDTERRPVPSRG